MGVGDLVFVGGWVVMGVALLGGVVVSKSS